MDNRDDDNYNINKESSLKHGNISIVLDSYDDIFSDFDPRPYSIRALSDDFLLECKKASLDKHDDIELRFLIPRDKRHYAEEFKIKKRLKDHFHKHFKLKEQELKSLKGSGFLWFSLGAIIMSIGAFLLNYKGYFYNFLVIISEPSGWFFFWEV